jgi:hypothetical protein
MSTIHILVIHYMVLQHYIWLVFYDLLLMTIGWKMPCWTFNDHLSFATHLLQLKAFSHIMSGMITKSMMYKVVDLRICFNAYGLYELVVTNRLIKLLLTSRIVQQVFFCLSSSSFYFLLFLLFFFTLLL